MRTLQWCFLDIPAMFMTLVACQDNDAPCPDAEMADAGLDADVATACLRDVYLDPSCRAFYGPRVWMGFSCGGTVTQDVWGMTRPDLICADLADPGTACCGFRVH